MYEVKYDIMHTITIWDASCDRWHFSLALGNMHSNERVTIISEDKIMVSFLNVNISNREPTLAHFACKQVFF